MDQAVTGEKPAGEAIDFTGAGDGFLDRKLPGEGGEVAIADLDLHGAGAQVAPFEFARDVVGLLAQAGAKDGPVVGVVFEGVFGTDAFDIVAEFEGAIVLAPGELAKGGSP